MDYTSHFVIIGLLLVSCLLSTNNAQHEDIPYQNVEKICQTCECLNTHDTHNHDHMMLNCNNKNFQHILARWPQEFGGDHTGKEIVATFSGNQIATLQQLPATNATLTFSCRHCGIKYFQAPTFMDVPNITRLDLSWNDISSDELTADVFRGPYRSTHYEPIGLLALDLMHNKLKSLNKNLFEHTPLLKKLLLSYNAFDALDKATVTAISSLKALEVLDLSHTNIKVIPYQMFAALTSLQNLNLAFNKFDHAPEQLGLLGKTLQWLDLSGNPITEFSEQSFLGLQVLQRLNISHISGLAGIGKGTFTRLETLEYLDCSYDAALQEFDMDGLMHSPNLTELDISYCSISSLNLDMDLSPFTNNVTNTTTSVLKTWPKLHSFETIGNPWLCDCQLLQILEFAGAHHRYQDAETRCDTPYVLSGTPLSNLTSTKICNMQLPKNYRVVDEDPPRFLRKRYIILTAITASVVIVLGLVIGFLVVCIRRRLKRDDYGVEPIRYTSVRSSNLSAFSHVQNNNRASGHA